MTKILKVDDSKFLYCKEYNSKYYWGIRKENQSKIKWKEISKKLYDACMSESKHCNQ